MLNHASVTSLRKHWVAVLVCAILGMVAAVGYSSTLTPLYRSTSGLYFTLNFGNTASDLAQGSTYTSNQMLSFGMLATSPVVLDGVIEDLGLDTDANELARSVSVSTPRDTVVMEISAISPGPARAADIANATAKHLASVVEQYAPRAADGKATVTVRTIQPAVPARYQFSPDKKVNGVLGGLIGLAVGCALAVVLAARDNKVRDARSLTDTTHAAFLGALRDRPDPEGHEAVVLQEPLSPFAEEYRHLRTSLRFAALNKHPLTLVVASSAPGEGKSTVSLNLAAVLAESGSRVLLLDADLRRPRIAQYSHVEGVIGLSDVLVGETTLDDVVVPLGDSGVDVVPAGSSAPNPGELLSARPMAEILTEVRSAYDVVIVDTAPILAVSDALTLGQLVDGIVLVVRANRTTKHDVARSLEAIRSSGSTLLGVVLNGVRRSQRRDSQTYGYASQVATTPSASPGRAGRTRRNVFSVHTGHSADFERSGPS